METSAGLIPVFTAVVWIGCVAVGVAGLAWRSDATIAANKPKPLQVQVMNVQISPSASGPPEATPSIVTPAQPVTPPPPAEAALPAVPDEPAVVAALPSPKIAFALPTANAAKTVDAKSAVPIAAPATAPSTHPAAAVPAITHLTFGQGEGAQPAPEYPREAIVAHQQGTVVIRFTVNAAGDVTDAEVASSSWPMLNQAALRAVRDTWRFPAGSARTYDVPIEFRLDAKRH